MKIKALSKTYNGKTVLKTDEMVFEKGKVYAVIGPNGSGKSTFAKIAAGIIATAAFLAPLIVTSPQRRLPPFTTSFSKSHIPLIVFSKK